MCGIVGYVGKRSAQDVLLDGLEKLEYRGYDSAGVALALGGGIRVVKSKGRLAELRKKLELQALITGESLAQVASQTMAALACTDQAQDLPVLRPCIGMDKIEIIDISRKIGTFETSIEPYEDCCTIFTPPHPKTNPTLDEILAAEAAMPGLAALEAEAAENVEKIYIRMGDDELL